LQNLLIKENVRNYDLKNQIYKLKEKEKSRNELQKEIEELNESLEKTENDSKEETIKLKCFKMI